MRHRLLVLALFFLGTSSPWLAFAGCHSGEVEIYNATGEDASTTTINLPWQTQNGDPTPTGVNGLTQIQNIWIHDANNGNSYQTDGGSHQCNSAGSFSVTGQYSGTKCTGSIESGAGGACNIHVGYPTTLTPTNQTIAGQLGKQILHNSEAPIAIDIITAGIAIPVTELITDGEEDKIMFGLGENGICCTPCVIVTDNSPYFQSIDTGNSPNSC